MYMALGSNIYKISTIFAKLTCQGEVKGSMDIITNSQVP